MGVQKKPKWAASGSAADEDSEWHRSAQNALAHRHGGGDSALSEDGDEAENLTAHNSGSQDAHLRSASDDDLLSGNDDHDEVGEADATKSHNKRAGFMELESTDSRDDATLLTSSGAPLAAAATDPPKAKRRHVVMVDNGEAPDGRPTHRGSSFLVSDSEGGDGRRGSHQRMSFSETVARRRSLFQSVKGSLLEHSALQSVKDESNNDVSDTSLNSANSRRRRSRRSVFEIQREEPRPLSGDEKRMDVKHRAAMRQVERLHEMERAVQRTQRRTIVAESRRNFQESMREAQGRCMWQSVLCIMLFAHRLHVELQKQQSIDFFQLKLFPIIYLQAFRFRRRRELNARIPTMSRPTIEQLQKDKMLSYFGAEHLAQAVKHLRPVFFDAGDVVVYQGAEGHEGYIIYEGEVDVMVNKQWCNTLRAGDIFGTLGMISGEPRIATVKARTKLLCWMIVRDEFLSLGHALDERAMRSAMSIVTELHERNIIALYPHLLQGSQLRRFFMLSEVPVPLLDEMIPPMPKKNEEVEWSAQMMEPKAFKPGDVIVRAGDRVAAPLYVLRGKVRVIIPESVLGTGDDAAAAQGAWKCAEELLMYHLDIMEMAHTERHERRSYFTLLVRGAEAEQQQRRHAAMAASMTHSTQQQPQHGGDKRASHVTHPTAPVRGRSVAAAASNLSGASPKGAAARSGPLVIGPIPAQLLLCCPHALFNETSSVTIEAVTSVDAMRLSKHKMINHLMQDPATLYGMRRAASKIRAWFMPIPSRPMVLQTLFTKRLFDAHDFIEPLRHNMRFPSTKPVVIDAGETISFIPGQRDVLLVVKGAIDDAQGVLGPLPCLWPPLSMAFFGGYSISAKVVARLEAYRMRRVEIVELLQSLKPQQAELIQEALATAFERKVGRKPTFESTGNEYEALDDGTSSWAPDRGGAVAGASGGDNGAGPFLLNRAALRNAAPQKLSMGLVSSPLSGTQSPNSAQRAAFLRSMQGDGGAWQAVSASAALAHDSMRSPSQAAENDEARPLRSFHDLPRHPDCNTTLGDAVGAALRQRQQKLHHDHAAQSAHGRAASPAHVFRDVDLTQLIQEHRRAVDRIGADSTQDDGAASSDDDVDRIIVLRPAPPSRQSLRGGRSPSPPLPLSGAPRVAPFVPPLALAGDVDSTSHLLPSITKGTTVSAAARPIGTSSSMRKSALHCPSATARVLRSETTSLFADSALPLLLTPTSQRGLSSLSGAKLRNAVQSSATPLHHSVGPVAPPSEPLRNIGETASLAPPLHQPTLTQLHRLTLLSSLDAASPFAPPHSRHIASHAPRPPPRMTEAPAYLEPVAAVGVNDSLLAAAAAATLRNTAVERLRERETKLQRHLVSGDGGGAAIGQLGNLAASATSRLRRGNSMTMSARSSPHRASVSLGSSFVLPMATIAPNPPTARRPTASNGVEFQAPLQFEPKFASTKLMHRQLAAHMSKLHDQHKLHLAAI